MTSSAEGATQQHFSRMAGAWINRYEHRPSFRERLDVVAGVLDPLLRPGDLVLDFGSGAGVFSMLASHRAGLVVSVDQNEPMLHSSIEGDVPLRALIGARGVVPDPSRISRVVGDIACLRGSGTADVVLAIAVLEYVQDPANHLRALAALLRPGGHLLLTLPRPASLFRRLERPLDRAAARFGRLTRRRRMADREYSALRPAQVVDLLSSWSSAGLRQVGVWPVRLGPRGLRRHVTPNELFVLERMEGRFGS